MSTYVEFDGQLYIEVKANPDWGNCCNKCAFGQVGMLRQCGEMIDGKAEEAFGGDCMQRDVIYFPVPHKEMA